MQIAVLGGGRMGTALVAGLIDGGSDPDDMRIAESDADRRRTIESELAGVHIVPSAAWAVAEADIVVVAVKPAEVAALLDSCAEALGPETLVLSIAAGVPIELIEAHAPGRPVVRAMPNTPALVRQGASAIAPGEHATDAHLVLAERLLGAVGTVVRVPEAQLDAVTGLSGSGPAYLFLVAEALIEAGVLAGLTRSTADALVRQTLLGSATL